VPERIGIGSDSRRRAMESLPPRGTTVGGIAAKTLGSADSLCPSKRRLALR